MIKLTKIANPIFAITLLVSSCHTKPEDIKLNDLKSVCEYVEAMEQVIDADIKLMKERDISMLSDDERAYRKDIRKKLMEIAKAAEKKYSIAEVNECENFESFKEKFKQYEGKNRW